MSNRFPITALASALVLLGGCAPTPGPYGLFHPGDTTRRNSEAVGRTDYQGASTVEGWGYDDDGEVVSMGEGDVEENGSFSVKLPADTLRVVLEVRDEEGGTLGSSLLAVTAAAGEVATSAPVNAESSLEVAVYTAMVTAGTLSTDIDVVDLRARLDANLTVEAAASADANLVATLAVGVAAAQLAAASAYAEAGVSLPADAFVATEASAASAYDVALDADLTLAEDVGDGVEISAVASLAYDALIEGMMEARSSLGVAADTQWEGEAQAGLALVFYVEEATSGSSSGVSLELAAGQLEAYFAGAAAVAATAEAPAAESAAIDAAAQLEVASAAAAAAADVEAMRDAWAAFRGALVGPSSEDTLADLVLSTSAILALDGLLTATLSTSADLDASVAATTEAAVGASDSASVMATGVNGAWGEFTAETRVAAALVVQDLNEAEALASLVVLATGSFRAGESE